MRDDTFSATLRSGAERVAAIVSPPPAEQVRRRGDFRRRRKAVASGALVFAIGAGGGGGAYASLSAPAPVLHPAAGLTSGPVHFGLESPPAAEAAPGIVAVTTAGDVVTMNPLTGVAAHTLVSGVDAIGDAVSISSATVYFTVRVDCVDQIESVPLAGGPVTVVADGAVPAISPDGSKLAYVRGPDLWPGACARSQPGAPAIPGSSELVIRDLSTGGEHVYPAPPKVTQAQIPAPISHLSWAPDSATLLLSISSGQDNEGWDLVTFDPATARYYLPVNWDWGHPGGPGIPVTGAAGAYYFEGTLVTGGGLFVDKVCCAGVPVKTTSNLLDLISPDGTVIRQVAMGFLDRKHTSLAADPTGHWLLYLSGNDLFLSGNGAKANKLTTGVIAATWR